MQKIHLSYCIRLFLFVLHRMFACGSHPHRLGCGLCCCSQSQMCASYRGWSWMSCRSSRVCGGPDPGPGSCPSRCQTCASCRGWSWSSETDVCGETRSPRCCRWPGSVCPGGPCPVPERRWCTTPCTASSLQSGHTQTRSHCKYSLTLLNERRERDEGGTFVFLQATDLFENGLQVHVEAMAVAEQLQEVAGANGAACVVDEFTGRGQPIREDFKLLPLEEKNNKHVDYGARWFTAENTCCNNGALCAHSPFLHSSAETKHFFIIMMLFQEVEKLTEFRGTTKMVDFCFPLCFLAASRPNNSCI